MNQACNNRNLFFSDHENNSDTNKYFVNDEMITPDDTGDFLSIVNRQIREKTRVLDVGCAQGKLGRKLSAKDCTLIGIDINSAAIEYVKHVGLYADAFLCDITQTQQEAFQRVCSYGPYDYIVITDILEHLVDPTRTLLELRKILKEDGIFLVSVPNIANSDICLNLLNGRFNYGSMGILDNTHVKFFTKKSFQEWIDLINVTYPDQMLYCSYLGATYYTSDYVSQIEKKYPGLSHVLSARPESEAFQLLFMLSKQPITNTVKPEVDFDCVAALGDLLDNRLYALQNAPMLESEREAFKKMLQDKDAWIAEQARLLEQYKENQIDIATMAEKDRCIAILQEQVNFLTRVSEDKDEHIRQCEQVIQARDEAIAAKDAWISTQQEQVDYLTRVSEDKDEHIRQCEQVIQARDEAIAAKEAWISSQQEQVNYLTRVGENKDEHIRQCEQVIQARDEAIAAKDAWSAEQGKQVQFLQEELKTKEQQLRQSIHEYETAKEELLKLRQRLLDIESTWIWQHTKFMHKGI